MARPYEVDIRGDDKSKRAFDSAEKSINDVEKALKRSAKAGSQTASTFKGMTLSRVAVDAAYRLANALERAVAAGFQYNKTIETSKLGIGSILASQLSLVNAEGKLLEGREALNASLKLSAELVRQIEIRGLQTTATTEQLVTAFQNAVGPATAMGLSLQETRDVTLDIVQAAGALGIPMNQLNEEVRSIVAGTIRMDSRVAKALGLTNAMVKAWAEQNVLAAKLTEKLAVFRIAGVETAKTWTGLTSNMEEAISKISGDLTRDIFDDLKRSMAGVLESLILVNDEGVKINPEVMALKDTVNETWESFKSLLRTVDNVLPWETVLSLTKSMLTVINQAVRGWEKISESAIGQFIKKGVEGVAEGWEHIAGLMREGSSYLDTIGNQHAETTKEIEKATEAVAAQVRAYGNLSAQKVDAYRKAFQKSLNFLEQEQKRFVKLENQKIRLLRETQDLRTEINRDELAFKRRIADFDLDEKRLKRELAILKGRRGPLTEEEQRKERIAGIELKVKRLQEDRATAEEDNAKKIERSKQEMLALEEKTRQVASQMAQTSQSITTVEQALKSSSQGALEFNENLAKGVTTANQLAQNLISAGKAINEYNARLPQGLKEAKLFKFEQLEKELQAPMDATAVAATKTAEKMTAIKQEIPRATRELQEKRREWEKINEQADEHLAKIERIRYATREWGFKIEGQDAGGEYGPAYGSG